MNWFNKFYTNERTGSLACPNCQYSFDEQMMYSLSPKKCPQCGSPIVTVRRLKCIYTIDVEHAPESFRLIYDYLLTLSHKDANAEFDALSELFTLNDQG